MFPTLYHFLYDLTGISLPFLKVVNTFGFFVAMSIGAAFWAMSSEFDRRTALGQFAKVKVKQVTGVGVARNEYILNAAMAFVFGYKILFLMVETGDGFSPQDHVFSTEGSWLFGALAMSFSLWRTWVTDKKQRSVAPSETIVEMAASANMPNLTTVALLSGFLGAKVFHLLETPSEIHWDTFLMDLLTSGGWTFYGGLICGAAGVIWYASKKGMHWTHVFDAGGPAMMLSYGLGRFGCHFSGDGDWGIANLKANPGLPDWAWAYKYPHNVLGKDYASTGMEMIPGCSGEYCYQLAVPVYPTPLYEALMALGLFAILWYVLRNRSWAPFQYFSIYMMMAGAERMLIESIREHGISLYHFLGMEFSQAQMISLVLMILGVVGFVWGGMMRDRKMKTA